MLMEIDISLNKFNYLGNAVVVVVMVVNATFNNISVISWRSVLLVKDTRLPGENHRPTASHWQTLSYNVVSSAPRLNGVRTHDRQIVQVVVNPTTIRSRPSMAPLNTVNLNHKCISNKQCQCRSKHYCEGNTRED